VPIGWDTTVSGDYDTALVVEVENGTGVLAQLAAAIAQSHSNIERVDYLDRDFNAAVLAFNIQVRDRNHLAEVMRRLRRLSVVQSVRRQ
jgi:guanosine-3',5'-bis(diphosphate) 3'-pyrophosphohydrolase